MKKVWILSSPLSTQRRLQSAWVYAQADRSLRLANTISTGKGLTSCLSFVMSKCVFFYFPFGIMGHVWYLIVSIPDLCPLSYFVIEHVLLISTNSQTGSVLELIIGGVRLTISHIYQVLHTNMEHKIMTET